MTLTDRQLRQFYPQIKWNEPIKATVKGLGSAYLCRYCIAQKGFHGSKLGRRGGSFQEIEDHIEKEHR